MKKSIYLLNTVLIALTSCKKHENSITPKTMLPKTMIYKYGDSFQTITITYDGNKILSRTEKDPENKISTTFYTYTDNLITKKTAGNYTETYTYTNKKLATATKTYKDEDRTDISYHRYTHNTNETIIEENFDNPEFTGEPNHKIIHTYKKGNLIKREYTEGNSKRTYYYEYDNQNDPVKNILNLDLVIGERAKSKNNLIKKTYKSGPHTEIATIKYKYNNKGYAIEEFEINAKGKIVTRSKYTYQ